MDDWFGGKYGFWMIPREVESTEGIAQGGLNFPRDHPEAILTDNNSIFIT